MNVCVRAFMNVYMRAFMNVYMCAYVCLCLCVYVCLCLCVYLCLCLCVYVCLCVFMCAHQRAGKSPGTDCSTAVTSSLSSTFLRLRPPTELEDALSERGEGRVTTPSPTHCTHAYLTTILRMHGRNFICDQNCTHSHKDAPRTSVPHIPHIHIPHQALLVANS